jgi:hypothetical protein
LLDCAGFHSSGKTEGCGWPGYPREEVIVRIEHWGALTIARQVCGWLRQIFRHALVKVQGQEYNPAADLDVVAVPQRPRDTTPSCAWPSC